jgi:hypothetical protein
VKPLTPDCTAIATASPTASISNLSRLCLPISPRYGLARLSCVHQLSVFGTKASVLACARDLLCTVGLLRRRPSPGHVGVVHKLAQKCAREAMVAMPETSTTLKAVCYMLTDRFQFDQHGSLGAWPGLQNLLPSTS